MEQIKTVEELVAIHRDVIENGPVRVVVNYDALAVPLWQAMQEFFVVPEIVFIRCDGWTLGAPKRFACVAKQLWSDQWLGISTKQGLSEFWQLEFYPGRTLSK